MSTTPSPITTHVLDTARGLPAVGVPVTLCLSTGETWRQVGHGVTDGDGRLRTLLEPGALMMASYRLRFDTAPDQPWRSRRKW